jgi:hypothetical protein
MFDEHTFECVFLYDVTIKKTNTDKNHKFI